MSGKDKLSDSDARIIDNLSYYGAFHNNPWNQLIHVLSVPVIEISFVVFLRWLGVIYTNDLLDKLGLQIHLGTFFIAFYALYYISLGEYEVTVSYALIQVLFLAIGTKFADANLDTAIFWFLTTQLFCWGIQVAVGHYIIEKRSPSLLDSAFDAFVMAPLFTWWETLFYFGYRKEFQKKLQIETERKIKILNAGGSIKPKRAYE